MGIFVSDIQFTIDVFFEEVLINDVVVSVKVCNSSKSKITCLAKGRDFETMSKILEESTVLNSINGSPMLRTSNFYKLVIKNFFKEIKVVTDEEEEIIEITLDNINKIHYNLVKTIAKKWMIITGD